MKLLLTPTLLRATLVWVLLGALTLVFPLLAKAQTNDQGAVVINGQISIQTCVLVMSESNNISNNTNSSLTLKLGNVPLTTAQAAAEGHLWSGQNRLLFHQDLRHQLSRLPRWARV